MIYILITVFLLNKQHKSDIQIQWKDKAFKLIFTAFHY